MSERIVLAFSGGLDTSYCVLELIRLGFEVHTVFVDTGGVSAARSVNVRNITILGDLTNSVHLPSELRQLLRHQGNT